MKKAVFVICSMLLFATSTVHAEYPAKDMWMWTTINLDKKLNQHFAITFEEELRLFDNISRINLFFSNIGVSYRPNKSFKFSLVYRYINKSRVEMPYSQRHRLYFDAATHYKLNRWNFAYRLRLQGQVRDYYSSNLGNHPETYMRHKFDIDYSIGKYTPYIALEIRYQFFNPRFEYGNNMWDRTRRYIGCDYDLNKKNSVGMYYMLQHDFNNQNLENDYTIGMQYSHSF